MVNHAAEDAANTGSTELQAPHRASAASKCLHLGENELDAAQQHGHCPLSAEGAAHALRRGVHGCCARDTVTVQVDYQLKIPS